MPRMPLVRSPSTSAAPVAFGVRSVGFAPNPHFERSPSCPVISPLRTLSRSLSVFPFFRLVSRPTPLLDPQTGHAPVDEASLFRRLRVPICERRFPSAPQRRHIWLEVLFASMVGSLYIAFPVGGCP